MQKITWWLSTGPSSIEKTENSLRLAKPLRESKLWLFNYFKPFTKKRSNIRLGQYPKLSLLKARDLRREYQSLLIENIAVTRKLGT